MGALFSATTNSLAVSGHGLITGQPVSCVLRLGEVGSGIVFVVNGHTIKACDTLAIHTERGVTLKALESAQTLSIVEHFLGAVALLGLPDVQVTVTGAPELPILDGSAGGWLAALEQLKVHKMQRVSTLYPPKLGELSGAVYYQHCEEAPNSAAVMLALPAPSFKVTYALNFPHPLTQQRFVCWNSATDEPSLLLQARTFGFVKDLPLLQAKGFALGANASNTLGLNEDGSSTSPLRFDEEPIYHKILDLLGDFKLCGLSPLQLNIHLYALYSGHGAHIAFAKRLKPFLRYT